MSHSVSRRRFVKSASAAAGLGCLAPYWVAGAEAPAASFEAKNDRPLVAAIGVGGRGLYDTKLASRFGDIVAVCDADLERAEQAREALGGKAAVFQDYRKLLETRPDIDVIINGTPDHWHTAVNVAACRAGKDIYTEKPLTLTIEEGKILRQVVRETGRIVQVGTQQRSAPHFRTACELVRNGRIGKLRQVAVLLPFYSYKGGPFATQPVPPKLDWDFYQGQAPERPYCRERTHFSFRFWSEYGGGKITDWGQHHMDIAFWGMGLEDSGPLEVEAKGFYPNHGKPDAYDNSDRFTARMKFPGDIDVYFLVVRDGKYLKSMADGDMTVEEDAELFAGMPEAWRTEQRDGVMFIGDKGRLFANRGKAYGKAVEELPENPLPADAVRLYESNDHMGNFFECVQSRKQPISTVDTAHRVITACHLGNVSMHLNRAVRWDPEKERVVGDAEAQNSIYVHRQQRKPYTIEA
ncbi:MAG: Gfo/Idh/MocA family oxidoreductase [Planctomycetaceae bacterium]|nr:Gfo/Idh/MocA family oxidoreductase [Planctomycetaceae bacterium]